MPRDEFDSDFQRQLLKTITSYGSPESSVRSRQDGQREATVAGERLHQFSHQFNRLAFEWICSFGRLEMVGNFEWFQGRPTWRERWTRLSGRDSSRWTKARWPYVVLAIYFLCAILISVNIYFQCIYNANTARVAKIESILNRRNSSDLRRFNNTSRLLELKREFERRSVGARHWLKWLGTAYTSWPSQCALLIFLIAGLAVYVILPNHYQLVGWSLFGPRLMLNANYESELRTKLILDELRAFTLNSRMFNVRHLEQASKQMAYAVGAEPNSISSRNLLVHYNKCLVIERQRLNRRHQLLVQRLRGIALKGRLAPLNRLPSDRDRLSMRCSLAFLISTFYFELTVVLLFVQVITKRGASLEHAADMDSTRDFLYVLTAFLIVQFDCASAMSGGAILLVAWLDLRASAKQLRHLILDTIRINELRLIRLLQNGPARCEVGARVGGPRQAPPQATKRGRLQRRAIVAAAAANEVEICKQVVDDLVRVIIQCRITYRITKLAHSAFTIFSFAALFFVLVCLICMRLFSPYFEADIKSRTSFLYTLAVSSSFSYLALLSSLHQQHIEAFRELWSLAAQIAHFRSVPTISQLMDTDMSVVTLTRELADFDLRMKRLANHVFAVPITNQNLIRLMFWSMLFILSDLSLINMLGDNLGRVSEDPLGLFDFLM